ncbi:hypothetical protein EZV62_010392 [Acer yangbiense]|uniref:AB hydrolase-1 domain-containing protein n=1 Tax=Acer yangbiense TaxID=1000413 RepID=A0A5C7I309_9ROSI|nr:hypothetical protein EZV62_010392 [Acer yangbiense]
MEKIEHTTVPTNGINMHVASIGTGPVVLFLHGFPELWYSWRHQLLYLSSRGYRAIAPDLRRYGDTDAPPSATSYTMFHIVGDLVGLVEKLGIEQVFLVGHDWGAMVAWYFCMLRPDRVKALVNTTLAFHPRDPARKPVDGFRALFGDDHYICRIKIGMSFVLRNLYDMHFRVGISVQEPGEVEEEFAQIDTAKLMKKLLIMFNTPKAPCIPKNTGFKGLPDTSALPSWLSEEDINYYATRFNQKGFTGGLNYYRYLNFKSYVWPGESEVNEPTYESSINRRIRQKITFKSNKVNLRIHGNNNRTWELAAPWTGVQIKVPVKFIVGDLDLLYNIPGTKEYIHNGGFKKDVPLLQEVVVMEGVAHFLNQEKPEEVSEHIYDFINKF